MTSLFKDSISSFLVGTEKGSLVRIPHMAGTSDVESNIDLKLYQATITEIGVYGNRSFVTADSTNTKLVDL